MKYLVALIALLIGTTALAQQKVPNFKLPNLDDRSVRYADLKGDSLTVIDFWATWCKPCIKALPKLVELSDEFKSRGVQFIGISVDGPRNRSKVKPFAKSKGVDYPVLLDMDNEVMSRLRVQVVPTLLIVNKNDEIVHYIEGYEPGEERVIRQQIIDQLQ